MTGDEYPVMAMNLVIPTTGFPTCNGKVFPFYLSGDDPVIVESLGAGQSKVTLTIYAQGVTVEG